VAAAQGNSENDQAILRACVGLFLFGVPNRGLNTENLLSLVKENNHAPFVYGLMQDSDLLQAIHSALRHNYKKSLRFCFVVSFYETKDTKTVEVGSSSPEAHSKTSSSLI
jgi:hypothetical protein